MKIRKALNTSCLTRKDPNDMGTKGQIIFISNVLCNRVETSIPILRQWVLTSHDRRNVYVPIEFNNCSVNHS